MNIPVRMQIVCDDMLVAEIICDQSEINRIWSAYSVAKYRKGLRAGGAMMQRADLPRYWDIPVGERISHGHE